VSALAALAQAAAFEDATTFRWLDERIPLDVAGAARLLYDRFYVRGGAPAKEGAPARERLLSHAMARALAQARPAPRQDPDLGWHHAPGAKPHAPSTPGTARAYWHLCREGALPAVRALRLLDEQGLSYHFKVLNDPGQFVRCDAAVLYAPRESMGDPALAAFCRALAPWLRPGTPAFARPVAKGVALADDPGGGESFGLHRCRLAAQGLLAAQRDGRDRLAAMEEELRKAGLDAPHLAPGRSEIPWGGA